MKNNSISNKSSNIIKKNIFKLSNAVFFISLSIFMKGNAVASTIVHSATDQNAVVGQMYLTGEKTNPCTPTGLVVGPNPYNYIALLFRPTEGAEGPTAPINQYWLRQSKAPVDTTMILYNGRFDPLKPALGYIAGNDDSNDHSTDVGSVLCGGRSNLCPSLKRNLTSGSFIQF